MTPVFGIGSVIYTGIEIGVHLEPGLGCVEVTTVLRYCTVLYCTVLYCTVLYCTVLYCTVLYCVEVTTVLRYNYELSGLKCSV